MWGRKGVHSQPVGAQILWQPPLVGPIYFWIRNRDGKGVLGLNPCSQPAARGPNPTGGGLTWEGSAGAPAGCQAQINQLKTSLSIMGKAPK